MVLNFNPFPVIHTKRLTLRALASDDTESMFLLRSNEEVSKYIHRIPYETTGQARAFIDRINTNITNNESIMWAIVPKDEHGLIGTICLWNIAPQENKAEIGYELIPSHQGRGLMQEAVTAVIKYGFNTVMLDTLEAIVQVDNQASIRLCERNNFIKVAEIQEGDAEEGFDDMLVYELKNPHLNENRHTILPV